MEVVIIMKGMKNTIRWPGKPNNLDRKHDTTKWCEFHADHSHITLDCIALRLEVIDLLNKGHLPDLLSNKGKNILALRDNLQMDHLVESTPERIVNVIMGGSEVSGITYSAAKWHARVAVYLEANFSQPPSVAATDQIINFVENKALSLIYPYNSALVISLLISNCRIKRVLVDNGSFTNVLLLNSLKEIKIDESNIHRCSTILVGFGRDHKFTMGDITLPVYAGGVNLYITIVVLFSSSAYNVILRRP